MKMPLLATEKPRKDEYVLTFSYVAHDQSEPKHVPTPMGLGDFNQWRKRPNLEYCHQNKTHPTFYNHATLNDRIVHVVIAIGEFHAIKTAV
jgi:hypothetical protein